MTIVNKIEQRILEMDGGEFQKLCDAYLYSCGYGKPNSLGSVSGTNKVRKGTPDTFFEKPNGRFIFVEYTTQQQNLFRKLNSDLGKCFNEKKTEVPISKIEEIVLCYTGQLEPGQILSLKSKSENKGVKLTLFGISELAKDLFINKPLLVRDFFGLKVDTGQIIPLESFPSVYGKSKFAITLETKFHFREKESESFLAALESSDLVVISGKAGVGKSRFALEGCRNFIGKHPEYQAFSIVSQSQNLNDDLRDRFSERGEFLILVDDANRVISFSYFMYLLRNQKENQHIKVVVTVRDYALEKIETEIANYPYKSIQVDRLTDVQIKEFAKDEFGILNPSYLERIVELSAGNPRIAVMISKVAVDKNNLQSINDVSALYDEYFSSIRDDLDVFQSSNLLKTAGIIAFLRAVDRTNEQLMQGIQNAFHISPDDFWVCALQLHKLEMVDMYENEVVRISDQVLSTYLFYLGFFKDKVLDFSDILENYFPRFRERINDSFYPVISAFDQKIIFNFIRPKVKKIWDNWAVENNDENLLALADFFWHLFPNETLMFIQKRFSQAQFMNADFSQLEQLDNNKLKNVPLITELRILGRFHHLSPDLADLSLELLLDYVDARPADILQVLHVLVEDCGFDRFSNQNGVFMQQKIVNLLWKLTENGKNELYSRLFIAVGSEYLKTNFETIEASSKLTFKIYPFILQPKPDILQLRTMIFEHLFELYINYPQYVYTVIETYVNGYHQATSAELLSNDSNSVIRFVQENLRPLNFAHTVLTNNYLDFLETHNVVFDNNIRNEFQTDKFKVYRLLTEDRKTLLQYNYEEFQRIRKEHFTDYFANLSATEIKLFIDKCIEISGEDTNRKSRYQIVHGFSLGLNILFEVRPDLFDVALSYYLEKEDNLFVDPRQFVQNYLTTYGKEKTIKFLSQFDFPTKSRWLFRYCQVISSDKIDSDDLNLLYRLFQESDYSQIPNHLDFLLNYMHLDNRVVAKVAQIILDRNDTKSSPWLLNSITDPYSEINKYLVELFKEDVDTLKQVYLVVRASRDHEDHNSTTLSTVLKLDPSFIDDYIELLFAPQNENERLYFDHQDYSLIWRLETHRVIFKKIINLIYSKRKTYSGYIDLKQFFVANEDEGVEFDVTQRQGEILTEIICEKSTDIDFMKFLFEVIAFLPKELCIHLLYVFLQHNKSIDDFKKIPLESGSRMFSGSAVPIFQEQVDYLKSLMSMLNSAKFLQHRAYLQQRIDALEKQINVEKKRDFIGE